MVDQLDILEGLHTPQMQGLRLHHLGMWSVFDFVNSCGCKCEDPLLCHTHLVFSKGFHETFKSLSKVNKQHSNYFPWIQCFSPFCPQSCAELHLQLIDWNLLNILHVSFDVTSSSPHDFPIRIADLKYFVRSSFESWISDWVGVTR